MKQNFTVRVGARDCLGPGDLIFALALWRSGAQFCAPPATASAIAQARAFAAWSSAWRVTATTIQTDGMGSELYQLLCRRRRLWVISIDQRWSRPPTNVCFTPKTPNRRLTRN